MIGGVAVGIVTYNSAASIRRCLESVLGQTVSASEVIVWDNGSTDDSDGIARALGVEVVSAGRNLGFAAGANEVIRRTTAPYLLLLNPDAYPDPDYIAQLQQSAAADPTIGSLTGKLIRASGGGGPPVLDSTGHVLYRNRWVVNRGENQPDRGQYDTPGEVFGVCGAAALYRRAMLEDVRVGDDYFASAFFAYLEDVDLDWRARLRGWRAYYTPAAVAVHERGHKGKRGMKHPLVLRHSVKNRYLMMLRNDQWTDVVRDLPAILGMEAVRFFDFALTHPRALRGYLDVVPLIHHALVARREIQYRRLVGASAVRTWLAPYPFRDKIRAVIGGKSARAG